MADSTTDTPVLDLLASMTADSIEASVSTRRRSCSFASPRSPRSMLRRSRMR